MRAKRVSKIKIHCFNSNQQISTWTSLFGITKDAFFKQLYSYILWYPTSYWSQLFWKPSILQHNLTSIEYSIMQYEIRNHVLTKWKHTTVFIMNQHLQQVTCAHLYITTIFYIQIFFSPLYIMVCIMIPINHV